jgi:hypothetical protein
MMAIMAFEHGIRRNSYSAGVSPELRRSDSLRLATTLEIVERLVIL